MGSCPGLTVWELERRATGLRHRWGRGRVWKSTHLRRMLCREMGVGEGGQASPEEDHFGCMAEVGVWREERQATVCVASSHSPAEPAKTSFRDSEPSTM